jgi:hypothetical protein
LVRGPTNTVEYCPFTAPASILDRIATHSPRWRRRISSFSHHRLISLPCLRAPLDSMNATRLEPLTRNDAILTLTTSLETALPQVASGPANRRKAPAGNRATTPQELESPPRQFANPGRPPAPTAERCPASASAPHTTPNALGNRVAGADPHGHIRGRSSTRHAPLSSFPERLH